MTFIGLILINCVNFNMLQRKKIMNRNGGFCPYYIQLKISKLLIIHYSKYQLSQKKRLDKYTLKKTTSFE